MEKKLVVGVDIESFEAIVTKYRNWLLVHNYSVHTEARMKRIMKRFTAWCDDLGITRPKEVTKAVLESYKRHLHHQRSKRDGEKLKSAYVRSILVYVSMFFRWCARQGYITFNPMADFDLPKREKRIARTVLSPLQMEQVFNKTKITTDAGLRDRVVLETLYSTGLRRMELSNLNLNDIDKERGLVLVKLGKGKKDRLIPIGERAVAWIEKYLVELRPKWAPDPDHGALFLTWFGTRLSDEQVSKLVRDALNRADVKQKGAAHILRHSMATALLDNGADIRHVQEMLGHESIQSTQIYTKVSVEKLKKVHSAKHPARLERE